MQLDPNRIEEHRLPRSKERQRYVATVTPPRTLTLQPQAELDAMVAAGIPYGT